MLAVDGALPPPLQTRVGVPVEQNGSVPTVGVTSMFAVQLDSLNRTMAMIIPN
jgi:hypothetical protein